MLNSAKCVWQCCKINRGSVSSNPTSQVRVQGNKLVLCWVQCCSVWLKISAGVWAVQSPLTQSSCHIMDSTKVQRLIQLLQNVHKTSVSSASLKYWAHSQENVCLYFPAWESPWISWGWNSHARFLIKQKKAHCMVLQLEIEFWSVKEDNEKRCKI